MPNFDVVKKCTFDKTFRVESIKGQFDLQIDDIEENFIGNIDIDQKKWSIGIIYGRSGSGKSTIAKQLFEDNYINGFLYGNKSIVDEMPEYCTTEEITSTFNSVGFSTAWSWLKPYSVLSTGEKMRVDLSRAILEKREMIVFDEFSSVINREVAKIGSYAIQKAIRRTNRKFIAVSCHDDIIEWLEPDWTFNTNEMKFAWTSGRYLRPKIKLGIRKADRKEWAFFKKYHYLNSNLSATSKCFIAEINNNPVAFAAAIHFPHPRTKNIKRGHRLVVLPDFQGIKIGHELSSFVGQYYKDLGYRYIASFSNKALLNSAIKDKRWKLVSKKRAGCNTRQTNNSSLNKLRSAIKRDKYNYSIEYIGGGK